MKIILTILAIVVVLFLVRLWLRRRAARSGESLTALVLLMSKPHLLTEAEVREAIRRAWDIYYFGSEPQQTGNWIVEGGTVMPAMARPNTKNYLVSADGMMFLINSVGQPYMENPEKFANSIPDLRLRTAVGSHRAWISVDLFGPKPNETDKPQVYALLGKLLAEFANDDCLAVYCPELERCNEYDPSVIDALKSGQPLGFFDQPVHAPVVQIAKDDPRMIAAVEEAKRRWPEFVAAFQKRASNEEMFAIKARFAEGETLQFSLSQNHRSGI